MTQIELMQVALDLSKDFKFTAKPNPVVGALVVRNGEIVAQGAHESWGKNHAEINCLNNLDKSLPKDELTLYVTCLLYTSPSPRDKRQSRMPSSA